MFEQKINNYGETVIDPILAMFAITSLSACLNSGNGQLNFSLPLRSKYVRFRKSSVRIRQTVFAENRSASGRAGGRGLAHNALQLEFLDMQLSLL
jgi:hypothetical protein